jgi:uncharacterized repeat protein (TIGR03837 family)
MRATDPQQHWHIFCRVVDNFGDIGVCWRLAKQLTQQHHQQVTLWVDELPSFHQICHQVDATRQTQQIENINTAQWPSSQTTFSQEDIPDVIIEAFACELPCHYRAAMQQKWRQHSGTRPAFAWINLEYLSAEPWVESCHLAPSPVEGMRKTFFFPGFTAKTGGILFDSKLITLPKTLSSPAAKQRAIEHICQKSGVPTPPFCNRQITLFAYPDAVFENLIDALIADQQTPTQLWLLGGTLDQRIGQHLGEATLETPQSITRGALTITRLPFLNQEDYDSLLALADFNAVRGEESFVRAQMLGKPMLWHIYPQEENSHHDKLNAFLALYCVGSDNPLSETLKQLHQHWNRAENKQEGANTLGQNPYPIALKLMTQWQRHATIWQQKLLNNGDLTTKLVKYCSSFV